MKILHGLLEFLDINQFTEFVSQHISPCSGPVKGGSGDRLVKQLFFFYACHWGYSLLEFVDFSGKSLVLF